MRRGTTSKIPIVLAANSAYLPFAAVCIRSIIYNASEEQEHSIYIFYSDLKKSEIQGVQSMGTNRVTIQCVNISSFMDKKDAAFYTRAHYSYEMYYRWLIPYVLPQYDKVLYLDCDVVIEADIYDLYCTDVTNRIVAGALNFSSQRFKTRIERLFHLSANEYINSGVLLINCNKFKDESILEDCLTFLRNNPILDCPDQDAINVICRGNILYFDAVWNVQCQHIWGGVENELCYEMMQDRESILENAKILHFTSDRKPWNMPPHILTKSFWYHASNTPFYQRILDIQDSFKVKNPVCTDVIQ